MNPAMNHGRRTLPAETLENEAVFGLSAEVGSIEAGKRANLLLLRANPLDTVAAYDMIETIVVNGEPIAREALMR